MRRVTARVVAVFVALSFVSAVILLMSNPALACSCATSTVAEQTDRADAIFLGEILSRTATGQPTTYVVEVSRVFKGNVTARQDVVTMASGSVCGLELPGSGSALVFASTNASLGVAPAAGQLTANLCGGSVMTSTAPVSLGPGEPPTAVPVSTSTEGAAPSAVDSDPANSRVAVWLIGGLALVAAVGSFAVRRRRTAGSGAA